MQRFKEGHTATVEKMRNVYMVDDDSHGFFQGREHKVLYAENDRWKVAEFESAFPDLEHLCLGVQTFTTRNEALRYFCQSLYQVEQNGIDDPDHPGMTMDDGQLVWTGDTSA